MSAGAREDGGGDPLPGVLEVPQAVPAGPHRPGRGDDEGDAVTVPPCSALPGWSLGLGPRPAGGAGRSPGREG